MLAEEILIVEKSSKERITASITVMKLGRERTVTFPIVNVQGAFEHYHV